MGFIDQAKKAAQKAETVLRESAKKMSDKKAAKEQPIFANRYMIFWIRVYPNRVEFKNDIGKRSIPMGQIASVDQSMVGVLSITLETTGGNRYIIPTNQKKAVIEAIYKAQNSGGQVISAMDELTKLADLKERGMLTDEEFAKKKSELLGK